MDSLFCSTFDLPGHDTRLQVGDSPCFRHGQSRLVHLDVDNRVRCGCNGLGSVQGVDPGPWPLGPPYRLDLTS